MPAQIFGNLTFKVPIAIFRSDLNKPNKPRGCIVGLKPCEIEYLTRKFREFVRIGSEQRLLYFDTVSNSFCNEGWRDKFKLFLGQNRPNVDTGLMDELFAHAQISEFDPTKVTGCHSCREAFWRLVFLATT